MPTLAEIMERKKAGANKPGPTSGGLKITPESEKAALAANIKQVLDATAPKSLPQLSNANDRELGAMENGERIPMDHPAPDAGEEAHLWFHSLHSFESNLCIVIEPSSQAAWLAIQANPHQAPVLLHRLPLLNRPQSGQPF
jgi:hypothetical protein